MTEDAIITIDMLCERLRPIVLGGETSCLNGTPMVPLHIATLTSIYQHLRQIGPSQKALIEECAKVADDWNQGRRDRVTETGIAAAIRALSGEAASTAQPVDETERLEGAPISAWSWWVGSDDSVTEEGRYDLYECGDRSDAIDWAECHVEPGERFHIIEARCRALQADDEFMPFIAKRNHTTYVIDSEGRAALQHKAEVK